MLIPGMSVRVCLPLTSPEPAGGLCEHSIRCCVVGCRVRVHYNRAIPSLGIEAVVCAPCYLAALADVSSKHGVPTEVLIQTFRMIYPDVSLN